MVRIGVPLGMLGFFLLVVVDVLLLDMPRGPRESFYPALVVTLMYEALFIFAGIRLQARADLATKRKGRSRRRPGHIR